MLYTLQDFEHGLEACGETPEDCMKNLELALKAFEIYDKIKVGAYRFRRGGPACPPVCGFAQTLSCGD